MNEPDLEKIKAELLQLEDAKPAPIELSPLAAIAIVSHIQLAVQLLGVESQEGLTPIAIDVARQLQELFDRDSITYKMLSAGWDVECDRPSPVAEFCAEPCSDFRQNKGCRCTGYRVAEGVSGDDLPPEVLAKSVAIMEQVQQSLAE